MSEFETIQKELQELKQITLLGAKTALTMSDVCLLTGLSKSHLYKLVCYKKIPYYKSEGGKQTYFNKTEIENWLMRHRVATSLESDQSAIAYCATNPK